MDTLESRLEWFNKQLLLAEAEAVGLLGEDFSIHYETNTRGQLYAYANENGTEAGHHEETGQYVSSEPSWAGLSSGICTVRSSVDTEPEHSPTLFRPSNAVGFNNAKMPLAHSNSLNNMSGVENTRALLQKLTDTKRRTADRVADTSAVNNIHHRMAPMDATIASKTPRLSHIHSNCGTSVGGEAYIPVSSRGALNHRTSCGSSSGCASDALIPLLHRRSTDMPQLRRSVELRREQSREHVASQVTVATDANAVERVMRRRSADVTRPSFPPAIRPIQVQLLSRGSSSGGSAAETPSLIPGTTHKEAAGNAHGTVKSASPMWANPPDDHLLLQSSDQPKLTLPSINSASTHAETHDPHAQSAAAGATTGDAGGRLSPASMHKSPVSARGLALPRAPQLQQTRLSLDLAGSMFSLGRSAFEKQDDACLPPPLRRGSSTTNTPDVVKSSPVCTGGLHPQDQHAQASDDSQQHETSPEQKVKVSTGLRIGSMGGRSGIKVSADGVILPQSGPNSCDGSVVGDQGHAPAAVLTPDMSHASPSDVYRVRTIDEVLMQSVSVPAPASSSIGTSISLAAASGVPAGITRVMGMPQVGQHDQVDDTASSSYRARSAAGESLSPLRKSISEQPAGMLKDPVRSSTEGCLTARGRSKIPSPLKPGRAATTDHAIRSSPEKVKVVKKVVPKLSLGLVVAAREASINAQPNDAACSSARTARSLIPSLSLNAASSKVVAGASMDTATSARASQGSLTARRSVPVNQHKHTGEAVSSSTDFTKTGMLSARSRIPTAASHSIHSQGISTASATASGLSVVREASSSSTAARSRTACMKSSKNPALEDTANSNVAAVKSARRMGTWESVATINSLRSSNSEGAASATACVDLRKSTASVTSVTSARSAASRGDRQGVASLRSSAESVRRSTSSVTSSTEASTKASAAARSAAPGSSKPTKPVISKLPLGKIRAVQESGSAAAATSSQSGQLSSRRGGTFISSVTSHSASQAVTALVTSRWHGRNAIGSMSARYIHDDSDDDNDVSPSMDVDKAQRKTELHSRLSAGRPSTCSDRKPASVSAKNGSQTERVMGTAPVVPKLKLGGLSGKISSDARPTLSTGSVVSAGHHGHGSGGAVTSARRPTDNEHAPGQRKWV